MKLVIFDIDGTLTNTNQIDEDCFVRSFEEEFGICNINTNWAEYTYVTDSGITHQIFQQKLGRVPSPDELVRIKRRFVNLLKEASSQCQDLFSAIPGAANLITELKLDPDWCVAIATGGWRESAILKLEKANLEIQGFPLASADDGLSREDTVKAAILKAKNFYEVGNFSKIVFIGDGVWDVKAAYQLTLPFIGVGSGKAAKVLLNEGAEIVISDFTKLQNLKELLLEAQLPKISMGDILHITQYEQWEKAKNLGIYRGDTLDSEGFIHCSKPTQVIKVANNFFKGQKGLVLLCIDSNKVKAEIRYEGVEGDELFPHIYGSLNIDAVFKVIDFEPSEDGLFELPEQI